MSTATPTHTPRLSLDPETGVLALDGTDYTHLTWQEHRVLEDLLQGCYGANLVRIDFPIDDTEPPF